MPYKAWSCFKNRAYIQASAWAGVFVLILAGTAHYQYARSQVLNPHQKTEVLAKILHSFQPWGRNNILTAIAQHPHANVSILEEIWKDPEASEGARAAVLKSPYTPRWIFEEVLVRPVDYTLYASVAENPFVSPDLIEKLAQQALLYSGPHKNLVHTFVLAALVRRDDLSPELLQKILNTEQPEYFLVFALAQSSRVSCEEKAQLRRRTQEPLAHREIEAGLRKSGCPQ